MKPVFLFGILWMALLLMSCGASRKVANENATKVQEITQEEAVENDWLCVAGERVGPINKQTTLKDLEQWFGAENVSKDSLQRKDGTFVAATKVYEGTPNELRIAWKTDAVFQRIARVIIQQEGADWRTERGIKIGMPLADVEKINEVPFAIFGFHSPYAGSVFNWEDGALSEQSGLSLRFRYTNDPKKITSKELDYVMIEDEVTTDLEVYEELGVIVSHIYIFF